MIREMAALRSLYDVVTYMQRILFAKKRRKIGMEMCFVLNRSKGGG